MVTAQGGVFDRIRQRHPVGDVGGVLQVPLRQAVGVMVVVDQGGVFVRPGICSAVPHVLSKLGPPGLDAIGDG